MGSCVQFHFIVACTSEKSADQKLLENNYNIPFKDSRLKKPTVTTGSVSIMASRAINLDIIFVLTKCKSIIKFILSRWFLPLIISQSHEKPNSSKAKRVTLQTQKEEEALHLLLRDCAGLLVWWWVFFFPICLMNK